MEILGLKIPTIAKEGYFIVLSGFGIWLILSYFTDGILPFIGFLGFVWSIYFFRDPDRISPVHDDLVIAPADGIIQFIKEIEVPDELELGYKKAIKIAIFMNVFNVHVNRLPISGKITKINYIQGKFVNLSLDKESEDNERNAITIETKNKVKIGVVQIAGFLARRIVPFIQEGNNGESGEKFGLIKFGSRVDVYLPVSSKILVKEGQSTISGETLIASLGNEIPENIVFKTQGRIVNN